MKWLGARNQTGPGNASAAWRSCRPQVETLEGRDVPSGLVPTVYHDPTDGVLRVQGTPYNDTVHVRYDFASHQVLVSVTSSAVPPGSATLPVRISGWVGQINLYGYGGNDYLRSDVPNAEVFALGGDGNDVLMGDGGADVLFGEAGDDTLVGWGGNDNLDGGAGNDTLFGNGGNDQLFGGQGNDVLRGDDGNDLLCGGSWGWDTPWEYDQLFGGSGADTFALAVNTFPGRQWVSPDYLGDLSSGDAVTYNVLYLPF